MMNHKELRKVDVFHNILWPKYKGEIFSRLHALSKRTHFSFFHIARSDLERKGLGEIDLSYHRYPFKVLFDDAYDDVPRMDLYFALMSLVLRSKADMVILPGYHRIEYWLMLFCCVLKGKRRAVFVDSTKNEQPASIAKSVLKRIFFTLCEGFLCYGERSREYVVSFGVPEEKTFIGCQAAALEHGYTPKNALEMRLERCKDLLAVTYLYVGRLAPEKGLDVLIRAFEQVHAKDVSASLTIVGSGPLDIELQELVSSLGLGDSVTFLGARNIDDLKNLYLGASCLILPSRREPWGLVVNEAMSYGCPVIVSDRCGCCPELLINGETGYTFRTDDIGDLAEKMSRFRVGQQKTEALAKNCIEKMKDFTPDNAANKILGGCTKIWNTREGK
jgi:glycosyltransferase involved in cell wall biosynthesis